VRAFRLLLILAFIAGAAYVAYVGYEGSRQAVSVDETRSRDCRTPDVILGAPYEAINYDIADDEMLKVANPNLRDCDTQAARAGRKLFSIDGVTRLAGWYVPAANGVAPEGPTIVLVHGYAANKSDILGYGAGLHETFNLVAFDLRNGGRSTGSQTTYGVREQDDLRAVIDWIEREKGATWIGVLGNSMGAATAITEARSDPRVQALALDSMHTRLAYQFERRLERAGHPSYPGTWAIFAGAFIRTGGLDLSEADPMDAIVDLGDRPILLTHGTADDENLPERTEAFAADLAAAGVPVELQWCEGAGHGLVDETCPDPYAGWVRDFFTRALAGE
jgi:pimeloyl-ACP methyl ester carboxylesterase